MRVVDVFPTMQGEGSLTGTPAIFVRFAGCNLWSGHEDKRAVGRGDCADWCDTYFAYGDTYTPDELLAKVVGVASGERLVVLTGGEPVLQLRRHDGRAFIALLRNAGMRVAVETNGTTSLDGLTFDHVTALRGSLSLDHIKVREGTDLKVIVPQPLPWAAMTEAKGWRFTHRFLQPMDVDGGDCVQGALDTLALARAHGWRVSLQSHKHVRLP